MKKSAICLVFIFTLFFSKVNAGCGGPCISTTLHSTLFSSQDTVVMNTGDSTTLYSEFNSCCSSLLGSNIKIVWWRNGIAFDTTDLWTIEISTGNYIHELNVTAAGIYQTTFIGYSLSSSYNINCGSVFVKINDDTSALIPTANNNPSPDINIYVVEVFPNPFEENTTIKINSSLLNPSIIIFDILGENVMKATKINDTEFLIERNGASAGIYFFQIISNGKKIKTGKIRLQN